MADIPYEEEAWDHLGNTGDQQEAALVSIAVSMKRIADELEGFKQDIFAAVALNALQRRAFDMYELGDLQISDDATAKAAYDLAYAMLKERAEDRHWRR